MDQSPKLALIISTIKDQLWERDFLLHNPYNDEMYKTSRLALTFLAMRKLYP